MTAESLIKKKVIAYNTRNLEDFINCHHQDVALYNFGDKTPFTKGREELRAIYKEVFDNSPKLHTEVIQRMVLGNTVIDNEIVTGRKGIDRLKIIAIYQVEGKYIVRASFIRE